MMTLRRPALLGAGMVAATRRQARRTAFSSPSITMRQHSPPHLPLGISDQCYLFDSSREPPPLDEDNSDAEIITCTQKRQA